MQLDRDDKPLSQGVDFRRVLTWFGAREEINNALRLPGKAGQEHKCLLIHAVSTQ